MIIIFQIVTFLYVLTLKAAFAFVGPINHHHQYMYQQLSINACCSSTFQPLRISSAEAFNQFNVLNDNNSQDNVVVVSRTLQRTLLFSILIFFTFFINVPNSEAGVGDILSAASKNSKISYSQNAKNMGRLSAGDSSGGSTYDNNPTSDVAKKRRALTGCKSDLARKELGGISEKECNLRVFDGDYEYVLRTLRKLDCPTCPYGIGNP